MVFRHVGCGDSGWMALLQPGHIGRRLIGKAKDQGFGVSAAGIRWLTGNSEDDSVMDEAVDGGHAKFLRVAFNIVAFIDAPRISLTIGSGSGRSCSSWPASVFSFPGVKAK